MEKREDLASILPFLPLQLHWSALVWPPPVFEALKALSKGPEHSHVDSGELLFSAISDMRNSLRFPGGGEDLAWSAAHGYALFFDDLMSRAEAANWFEKVLPAMANLLLHLPSLLESHYQNSDDFAINARVQKTGLRLLESQQPGIVFLSQELIASLAVCSFFCLFPMTTRAAKHLPTINFDHLFASFYERYSENQENKIKCLVHYFGRICSFMPMGIVSFERKVLPQEGSYTSRSYPKADFWSKSNVPLCPFEVYGSGMIEDQSTEALEVDFANKYIGGGALHTGCVQEEIRFMINPELIASMLFLPRMAKNEAIEIVGTERFSNYEGYASSFRFSGDYLDKRGVDTMRRRKTRIIAIDALCHPGERQYEEKCLLREINKAFCGFLDQSECKLHQGQLQTEVFCEARYDQDVKDTCHASGNDILSHEAPSNSLKSDEGIISEEAIMRPEEMGVHHRKYKTEIGIVTGNWGCGAFGGDPEIKAIIQWLAASLAKRPFISYLTFGMKSLDNLDQVCNWILSQKWTVGDLWNILVEYSSRRLKGETYLGFFNWLIPSLYTSDYMDADMQHIL